ncbi:hypothetical protein OIE77_42390 [Streptomyces sp. NBC_01715]|uniref:hypothetical protein n=1 Tax=Streptomyces sp. NBC_01715 TaxID=2975916 RepID=UPI002E30D289|nr:hypothetical protein [Streptomyces sp. NBC_01715]
MAQGAVASAEATYDRRLRTLEQRIAVLRNPGSGARTAGLGELVLFEHLVVVTSGTGSRSIELAGLDVRFEMGQKNHSIYLIDATGQVHRAKYPHHPPVADPLVQRFDEDEVRDFAVSIQNAVARENSFRARIPQQVKQAEAELAEARADTSALDAAREHLVRAQERNRQDPHRKAAAAALEEARKDWESLTGRIPPV